MEVESLASFDSDIEVIEDGSLLVLSTISGPEPENKDSDADSIDGLFSMLKETSTDSDDEEANSRSIMELDELISMERENLELIKKANESIRDCVTASVAVVGKTLTSIPVTSETDISNETSSSVPISNGDSPTENETPSSTGEPTEIDNPTNNGSDIKEKDKTEIDTATIITPQKPTQNLFRGLPTARRRKPGQRTAMGVNEFIKDYYRSLDSVSRYIIIASILSFITAFTLLYFHGYQTHQQNMELFQLKEKQTQAQLERYELTKTQSTNFRETVIHQRFEETRQCQVSLKTCNINNEALATKIGKVEKDSSVLKLKLEMELKSSQDKIKQLQEAVSTLREANKELKSIVSQSVPSSFAQISMGFLNLLKNPAVYGCTLVVGALLFFFMAIASK